ncbi:MAG: signal peptidase II [Candidatus Omnitrophota bacterium]
MQKHFPWKDAPGTAWGAGIIITSVLLTDQLTKLIVYKKLFPEESIDLIEKFFSITLVCNTGTAFGLFKGNTTVFIYSSLFASIYLAILLFSRRLFIKRTQISTAGLSLILGGALGNLIDRIRYGFVIDFLDFKIWPVFNLADSAITVGVVILCYNLLMTKAE